MPTKQKPRTWESIYYASVRRGDDPAYALYLADAWKERKERAARRTLPPHDTRPSKRLDTWERVRRAQKRADARIAAHGRWAPQAVRAVNAYRAALQRVPTDSA